ncbi:hypothetical protein [Sedimentibacter saalensis]|uniref:hypothetical protein n=1 Tax=Sedimentibacter saalensis TaxID=130788 RepID=UPI002898D5A9|nr:hypothetical protein [Sedimentibacter saalensis]
MSENKQLTRKEFLKGMGYTAASVVAVGSISGLLTGCATAPAPAAAPAPEAAATAVDTAQAPQHPFPYKKLDPAVVEQRAFQGYKEKGG